MAKSSLNNDLSIDPLNIPQHVAIIMDGNGRWAKKRHLPRVAGHRQGMQTVKTITKVASDLGVKVLTLYAFSTENWKRPADEVKFIMNLPVAFFSSFVPDLIKNNVKVRVMGILDQLPKKTQEAVNNAIEETKNCTGMVLNFALNYGGRSEIELAVKDIVKEVEAEKISSADVNEDLISDHLMTGSLGSLRDPDLLIRTSGELRISNFLLWQIAYSEFIFTDTLWPDFNENIFKELILEYQKRDRRFGGLDKKDS